MNAQAEWEHLTNRGHEANDDAVDEIDPQDLDQLRYEAQVGDDLVIEKELEG